MDNPFPQPARCYLGDGTERRVGFELELAGVDMGAIDEAIVRCFGGRVEHEDRYTHRVVDTSLGDFVVEIDTALLKHGHYLDLLQTLGIELDRSGWLDRLDQGIARLAATVVPHEVVAPPIPLRRLHELERLRVALHEAQAQGTRAALRYAFGLHINVEAATLTARDVTAHLKAFLLLRDAIKHYGETDLSRRVAPFIRDFPDDYARRILVPDYWPSWPEFITDYVEANNTRNRPLDLLPLLASEHPDRLPAELRDDPLIKARPAYHYRLPNCAIDEPDWTLAIEWQGWLAVERLAADTDALTTLGNDYLAHRNDRLTGIDTEWASHIAEWLDVINH